MKKLKRQSRKGKSFEGPIVIFPTTVGGIFLPDCLPQVRAIAARGLEDHEIAMTFGVSKDLFARWKAAYPDFRKALELGRLMPDAAVVESAWKRAVGYDYTEDGLTRTGAVRKLRRHLPGEPSMIRYWLNNRKADQWGDKTVLSVGGDKSGDAKPIGIKSEGKAELMSAILAMIQPKPDNIPEKKR